VLTKILTFFAKYCNFLKVRYENEEAKCQLVMPDINPALHFRYAEKAAND
jgi:hypothetical protein